MRRVCALLHDRQLEDFIDMDTISETKTETKKPKKPKKAEKAEVVKSGDPLLDEGSTTKRYDPAGLMARAEGDPKWKVEELPAGVERLITVAHRAIAENTRREERNNYGRPTKLVPTIVVREKRDGALHIVGVYRNAQFLGPASMEYLPPNERFRKTNGDLAMVVQRSSAAVRVFTHADDEQLMGDTDWARVGC